MVLSKLRQVLIKRYYVGARAFSGSYRKTLEKHPILVQACQVRKINFIRRKSL